MATTAQERSLISSFGKLPESTMAGRPPDFMMDVMGVGGGDPRAAGGFAEWQQRNASPPPSIFASLTDQGMDPANAAKGAAAMSNDESMANAQAEVRVAQTDRGSRAKLAAREFMQNFPEASLGFDPLDDRLRNAISDYARNFDVSEDEIRNALKNVEQDLAAPPPAPIEAPGSAPPPPPVTLQMQTPAPPINPMTGIPDLAPRAVTPRGTTQQTDPFAGYAALQDIEQPSLKVTPAEGTVLPWDKPEELSPQIPVPVPAPTPVPAPMAPPPVVTTPPIDPGTGMPGLVPPKEAIEYDEDILEASASVTADMAGQLPAEEAVPAVPDGQTEAEVAVGSYIGGTNLTDVDHPDAVFGQYSDPYSAIFESKVRSEMGDRGTRNPALVATAMKGKEHALGSWVIDTAPQKVGTAEGAYGSYLEAPKSTDEAIRKQNYAALSKASALAYQNPDDSFAWTKGTPYSDWKDAEKTLYHSIVTQQPEVEFSIVLANEGITGRGPFGQSQMQGARNLFRYWQNEQIRNPNAPKRGFISFWNDMSAKSRGTAGQTPVAASPPADMQTTTPSAYGGTPLENPLAPYQG